MTAHMAVGLKLGYLVSFVTISKRNEANGSFILDKVVGEASRERHAHRGSLGASDIFVAAASPPPGHHRRWGHRRYRGEAATGGLSLVGPTSIQLRRGSSGKVRALVRMHTRSQPLSTSRRSSRSRAACSCWSQVRRVGYCVRPRLACNLRTLRWKLRDHHRRIPSPLETKSCPPDHLPRSRNSLISS